MRGCWNRPGEGAAGAGAAGWVFCVATSLVKGLSAGRGTMAVDVVDNIERTAADREMCKQRGLQHSD